MENNENQQSVTEELEQAEQELTAPKAPKQTLLWIAIVILLGAVAGLSWFAYQQELVQQQKIDALITQAAQEDPLENEVYQLQQALSKQMSLANEQRNMLKETDVDLAEKIVEIASLQELTNDGVKEQWLLSEVEYLLQVANQRLSLAGDVENARTALILADQQLQDLADPRLYQLRALIADDQLALASVAKVDIDGLAAQLQSAIDSIDTLQVLTGPELTAGQTDVLDDEAASVSESWKAAMSDAWNEVRSLVVIRHQQDGSSAIIVPEQRYFLYQNLQLKLETARHALLSGREAVFHESLASAEQWLQQYFIGEERDALLQSVKAMQAERITVTLPDVSASLRWLQQKGGQ